MKQFSFEVKEKVQENTLKLELAKWGQKHFLSFFSNARSILELLLCNRKFTKLGYQTLLSSNCRA